MRDDYWWQSCDKDDSLKHGNYLYRLPVGAYGTKEEQGYSMWHLLAIQALSPNVQSDFLSSAAHELNDVLLDDLQESMTIFDPYPKSGWKNYANYRFEQAYSWERLRCETAWKTPLEICKLLKRPLIEWPCKWESFELHPVIQAFQAQSLRNART